MKLTLDKNGLPYVIHPLHLAKRMETEAEICTALLHDAVEAVGLLTRRPQEDYLAYIARLRKNPIARRVKLADLDHNTDFGRKESVDAVEKYDHTAYSTDMSQTSRYTGNAGSVGRLNI
ncbi:MAG TPA: hypothetical protein IAA04_09265 [Candidatus Lachnoclostridium pullistercoris]|uniref:GTP pyrophosphokinase n=1 Tax=Candidatus Lachnoclostridium pullistercoris TaxID=2838632 RepID=A0A9D2T7I4_9FIRM|nr:hypothetical protein [Candidatus Lachnoclostridium pullistercoris]